MAPGLSGAINRRRAAHGRQGCPTASMCCQQQAGRRQRAGWQRQIAPGAGRGLPSCRALELLRDSRPLSCWAGGLGLAASYCMGRQGTWLGGRCTGSSDTHICTHTHTHAHTHTRSHTHTQRQHTHPRKQKACPHTHAHRLAGRSLPQCSPPRPRPARAYPIGRGAAQQPHHLRCPSPCRQQQPRLQQRQQQRPCQQRWRQGRRRPRRRGAAHDGGGCGECEARVPPHGVRGPYCGGCAGGAEHGRCL